MNIICFSCGAKGYYTSDIKCPNYGNTSISQCTKPQLQVACADDDHDNQHSIVFEIRENRITLPSSFNSSQFDEDMEYENKHLDSTSTVSAKQEVYQRPVHLDTPFLKVDSDDNYIVYNHVVHITNTSI
jgi:hypothetical protein